MTHHRSPGYRVSFRGTVALGIVVTVGMVAAYLTPADARREVLTEADKTRLRQAERIHLEVLALTDTGTADHAGIASVVTARLTTMGYHVGQDPTQAHDAVVKVKCEEHKTWEGTARSGGDADTPGGSSRLWRGPACQLSYRLEGLRSDWRHEVRADLREHQTAAEGRRHVDSGAAALTLLADRLSTDVFPFLLAAEWGQSTRLLAALQKPDTDAALRTKIISLLGGMAATDAMPALATSLQDPDIGVAKAAAVAIGAIGHQDGIPLLLEVFKNGRPELHQAAAQGLGRLAPLYPQTDIVPVLLDRLPTAPVPVQTEIVRALATTSDRRSFAPLEQLNRDIQANHATDRSPEMLALKRALGAALDQVGNTHGADE